MCSPCVFLSWGCAEQWTILTRIIIKLSAPKVQHVHLCQLRWCVRFLSHGSYVVHLMIIRPQGHFRVSSNINVTEIADSIFPLCVSIDCAAERSCPQSGATSPSHSTSSHTLSSAKSKGSLRRQSKSVVWSLLYISTFSVSLLSTHFTLKLVHPSLIFHIFCIEFVR